MTNSSLRALWRFLLASYVMHCALAFVACLLTWWTVTYLAVGSHWAGAPHEALWRLTLRSLEWQLSNRFIAVFFVPVFAVAAFWWRRVVRLFYLAAAWLLLALVLLDDGEYAHPGSAIFLWNLALAFIAVIHFFFHGALHLWERRSSRAQVEPIDSV
ncbi:hypothetical protein INH39_26960 [Massilia violaceinigra]|uniref:Transmembrane protein n=1 Tax=Massilia violaceinigra TaxID=2045208 RepID=A0ABY4A2N6_9BURK|nr:hypothetical protein [Massilia violaceinigra]UOD29031.1 hypothetical protein INH39_26960 [Massilia violaceinigra]